MTWYVVCGDYRYDEDNHEQNWTLSNDIELPGWCTDGGHYGYGLPYSVAKFLCDAANEKETRDGVSIDEWERDRL